MDKIDLTYGQLQVRARALDLSGHTLYGVPNGGVYAALIAHSVFPNSTSITEDIAPATVIIDDIIDSGKTRERYERYHRPFFALVDKTGFDKEWAGTWVSFPWERSRREDGPQDSITRILQYIGEDTDREGLRETPDRVVRSYGELFAGYKQNPEEVVKTFKEGVCDEMVVLKGCEVISTCEHHLLPFFGTAHVAYIPDGRIIGISKLARLLEVFTRRLQVQERLTEQVTAALDEYLKPKGSACVIEARHLCMLARGVRKQSSTMVTSSLTGVFRKPEVRAEFFNFIQG